MDLLFNKLERLNILLIKLECNGYNCGLSALLCDQATYTKGNIVGRVLNLGHWTCTNLWSDQYGSGCCLCSAHASSVRSAFVRESAVEPE